MTIEFTQEFAPIGFTDPLTGITLTAADVQAAQDALNVTQGFPRDKNNWAPRLVLHGTLPVTARPLFAARSEFSTTIRCWRSPLTQISATAHSSSSRRFCRSADRRRRLVQCVSGLSRDCLRCNMARVPRSAVRQ